jgi:hypothetical protein
MSAKYLHPVFLHSEPVSPALENALESFRGQIRRFIETPRTRKLRNQNQLAA